MKLTDIAKKPELIKVVLDDAPIIEQFKEPVEFYTYDRVPLDTFTKLASINQNNAASMFNAVKDLILDETGHLVLSQDKMLPPTVLIAAIQKIVGQLGN